MTGKIMKELIITLLLIYAPMTIGTDFVYIITGQSNAMMQGNPYYLTANDRRTPDFIKYCGNAGGINLTRIGEVFPNNGYGVEVQLKNRLYNNLPSGFGRGDRIIIVKSAIAEPISKWKRYGSEYARLMESIVKCRISTERKFVAMLLLHGEANRGSKSLADAWGPDTAIAVTDIRAAIGAPDMPVIYTKIGVDIMPAHFVTDLRISQDNLPNLVSNVYPIETSYLEKKIEGDVLLHYKYPEILADMMYDKFLEITRTVRPLR